MIKHANILKAITPLLWRVIAFLGLFIIISGLIGPPIIGDKALFAQGFEIYGGAGKALIFGAIAFLLLARRKKTPSALHVWQPQRLWWLAGVAASLGLAWWSIGAWLASGSTWLLLGIHGGLLLSVLCAIFVCASWQELHKLYHAYRPELQQSAAIAVAFYVFLLVLYALWKPIAWVVMYAVQALLQVSGLEVTVLPPNTILLDKFGITIAEFCSGIESIALFTGLYLVVGLLDWHRFNQRRYFWVFPLALFVLCALNILRVYALIMAGYFINPDIAFSLFHTYAGLVFFIIYSAAFWAVAYRFLLKSSPGMKRNTPRNIIVSHVYSSANKGDAALTSVLLSDIQRKFPGATVTILTLDTADGDFEGTKTQPGFMGLALQKYRNPVLKLAYAFFMMAVTLVWARWLRRTGRELLLPRDLQAIARLYARCDLIIGVGGGYLRSRKGLMNRANIPLLLHPLWFAHLLGKPTVLYSQSVGPFVLRYERWLTAAALRRMTLIILREDTSVALLDSMGIRQNVVRSVDSGFLLGTKTALNVRKKYNIPRNALLIGVTVRDWLDGPAQAAYEQAVACALDAAVEQFQARVLFIPQVTASKGDDDRVASQRVFTAMRHQDAATVITETPSHHRIKALYDGLDILLGTRFHSVIFSLTSYVPVVAIEYEHKTSGIMRDLNLEAWVVRIEDATAKNLTLLLTRLAAEQTSYRQHLHTVLPPYLAQARQTIDLVERALP